jgi:PAS domain S-box-containing protein
MTAPQSNSKPHPRPLDLKRLMDAARRADAADWPMPLDGVTWQSALEELNVAHEELRQQNDELFAATIALQSEQRRYHDLFDFAPDCYLLTDPYGLVRQANLAAADLLAHEPTRIAGRPLRLYVHIDRRAEFDLLINRLRAGKPVRAVETLIHAGRCMVLPVSLHASPDMSDDGEVVGIRWLLHDLTQLKDAQDRAVKAERLAAVGQTVAALAHESRNALQRSQSCLRLAALESEDRPKALEYIARVQKAQEDLAHLFEDVRTFTAPPVVNRERCDLGAVWRDAWRDLEQSVEQVRTELIEDIHTDDLICHADPFRIRQVFRNLFDNARAADARTAGRPALQLTVEDNGAGLTAEQRQGMFDPFFTTKTGGMGLGLAIARRVIEAHDGTITAMDGSLGGAAFVVMLPRAPIEDAT